jgi:hypothetical protein
MVRPKTWWTFPSWAITPNKTFFGLGQNKAHTFNISKYVGIRDDFQMKKWLYPDSNLNYHKIELLICNIESLESQILEAEIRWTTQSTGREVDFMQWKKFEDTQQAIKKIFKDSYIKVEKNVKNEKDEVPKSEWEKIEERAVFHHLGGNRFMLERRTIDEEGDGDIPTLNTNK